MQLFTDENNIGEISIDNDEHNLALAICNPCQILVLEIQSGQIVSKCPLNEQITSLAWSGRHLYAGGADGSVLLLDMWETNHAAKQILALDSSIVQLATHQELLVASTLTRAVVCNIQLKTFREVGSKLRQGKQGITGIKGKIWAARPGSRIWEVDAETGSVLSTKQFRKALNEMTPTPIVNWNTEMYGYGGEHGFSLLYPNNDEILVSHSQTGRLYFLDMKNSGLVAWTSIAPCKIVKTCFDGNMVAILDSDGIVRSINFGPLMNILESSYELEKFSLCCDILLSNRSTIKSLPLRDISSILKMKDMISNVTDKEKVAKVKRLMDSMDNFIRKSLSQTYRRQMSSEQVLSTSIQGRTMRSMSQERNQTTKSESATILNGNFPQIFHFFICWSYHKNIQYL